MGGGILCKIFFFFYFSLMFHNNTVKISEK